VFAFVYTFPYNTGVRKTERAYLAGIIDGEGCISLTGRVHGKYITPIVQITNTNKDLIFWLQRRFGGSLYVQNGALRGRKTAYKLVACAKKAQAIVREAFPYLRIKREHAKIILSIHRQTKMKRDSSGRLQTSLTVSRIQANRDAVDRIRKLNRRGLIA
jgi:hypothetical protein